MDNQHKKISKELTDQDHIQTQTIINYRTTAIIIMQHSKRFPPSLAEFSEPQRLENQTNYHEKLGSILADIG